MISIIRIRRLFVIHNHYPAGGHSNDISSPAFNLTIILSCPSYFMCPRKPCLKPSSYSTLGTTSSQPPAMDCPPIRVANKPKRRRRLHNIFVDDRGFPNESEYYENLLHNIDGGPILRKLKHPPPLLDEVDPEFFTGHILNLPYATESTSSSKSIGLSLTRRVSSFQSRTMNV